MFVLKGSFSYVSQQTWIQQATLRENITFKRRWDPALYQKVVDACALKHDLDILPSGDQTEIGEKVRDAYSQQRYGD